MLQPTAMLHCTHLDKCDGDGDGDHHYSPCVQSVTFQLSRQFCTLDVYCLGDKYELDAAGWHCHHCKNHQNRLGNLCKFMKKSSKSHVTLKQTDKKSAKVGFEDCSAVHKQILFSQNKNIQR